MKKAFGILTVACFSMIGSKAQLIASYNSGSPGQPFQEMWIKGGYALFDQLYVIKGEQVAGTPFLYPQWLSGTVTLKDGRIFNNYKLKYDAYNQELSFLNGTDSMDVADDIKSFELAAPERKIELINASEYAAVKKPVFFESLAENAKGTLLKSYKKIVKSGGVRVLGMPDSKYLDLSVEYSYYNKKTGKLSPIALTPNKISSMLGLTADEAQKLDIEKYDFSVEANLIIFFNNYFASVQ